MWEILSSTLHGISPICYNALGRARHANASSYVHYSRLETVGDQSTSSLYSGVDAKL